MENGSLSDLKVLELGHLISGPHCAKLLADLGAEVVKVEEPGIGDEARRREPFLHDEAHPEHSGLFLHLNTNKLGVTLNVESETGRRIFRELVKGTDILVENNPPCEMKKLGLDYESLREINPRLVMTSITAFGQSGPYRDYKATELIGYHMGGLGYVTPPLVEDAQQYPPLKAGGPLADICTGATAAVATMCAVSHRAATGLGQHVDVSEHEAMTSFFRSIICEFSYTKTAQGRTRETRRPGGYDRILACNNGYVNLAPVRDEHWKQLVEMMGHPEWAEEELFKDATARRERGDELRQILEEWTKQHSKEEIAALAQRAGFPGVPVNSIDEAINWDHFAARELFVEIEHPKAGKLRYPRGPYILSETPCHIARPAPLLGEHNEEVYCGRLGYSKQELVRLAESGII